MAIDYSQFIYKNRDDEISGLSSGLQSNKTFTKYLYIFRIQGRLFRKVFDLSKAKGLRKGDLIKKANSEAEEYRKKKEDEVTSDADFTLDTKFKELAEKYIELKCDPNTKWTGEKVVMLDNYIYPHLKNKKASAIKEMDIDKIRVSMETSGHGVQNKDGCSDRTIRKVLLQVLKPILKYGYRNGAMSKIPEIQVPGKTKKKKVKDGTGKLILIYATIHDTYRDDPFYRALFLFAFFGRRWNEIRTLEWTDIDFDKSEYTILDENSKIDEDKTFSLPRDIVEALSYFKEDEGLIFKSPKTGKKLSTPKRQIERLKKSSGIEELTLHYFRHIAATALGEGGLVNTVLSAALGHNNSKTVDDYYRTANHLKGSQKAIQAIEHIVEVGDE